MAGWTFRRMTKGEMNSDPVVEEFFNTDSLKGRADALVREAIQNSLDAARPGVDCVRVRIALRGLTGDSRVKALNILRPLRPHLEARGNGLKQSLLPKESDPLEVLVVEDFGTRGLCGDVTQHEDAEGVGPKNDYYYFWRNVGRGEKGGDDRGRWGMGKTVFPGASRINVFLGLTVRSDDQQACLMGQGVLKIHHLNGNKHAPWGYYGVPDKADHDFILPVTDNVGLAAFENAFGVTRSGQAGLSVVVPYPDPEITAAALLESVIKHYFHPILQRGLIVEIEHGDLKYVVNADSLEKLADANLAKHERDRWKKLFSLTRWAQSRKDSDWELLEPTGHTSKPEWTNDLLPDVRRKELGQALERDGARLAFRVQVWVKLKGRDSELCSFDVVLERDDGLSKPDDHFIRQGITISEVQSLTRPGMRALVVAGKSRLATLLGDSENPAHTQWVQRGGRLKRYEHGDSTVGFVKRAPRELVKMLFEAVTEADLEALSDVFYVEDDPLASNPPRDPPPGGVRERPPGEPHPPETSKHGFVLTQTSGGFRLSRQADGPPLRIQIRVAYNIGRGNPFKRWRPADFRLHEAPIEWIPENVIPPSFTQNEAHVVTKAGPFSVVCKGFDPNRDLAVDARVKEAEDA